MDFEEPLTLKKNAKLHSIDTEFMLVEEKLTIDIQINTKLHLIASKCCVTI